MASKDFIIPSTEFQADTSKGPVTVLSVPNIDIAETGDQFSWTISFAFDETHSQLSTPRKNTPEEERTPPEIVSSSISTTRLQCELLRPLLAGSYQSVPAYLLKLQFQFQVMKGDRSWLKRIQAASISVVFEDAPLGEKVQTKRRRRAGRQDGDVIHPAVVKTFPGPEGWQGPISTSPKSNDVGVGLQAGWMGLGADVNWSQSRTKDESGAAKVDVMRTGPQRNCLFVNIMENPVDAAGIPALLVIPLIVTHHSRRFSMRVTVKATFGFWRGKLAEYVPVLGRADDPVYFDTEVLKHKMEAEEKGIGGTKVMSWAGELESIVLQGHSSLAEV
jgi:hypothetical protein